jgi:hypothetical protein
MDRGYAKFALFNKLHSSDSSYVCRLRGNSTYEVLEGRPLSEAAKAAGIVFDGVVRLGATSKADAQPDHPIRLVLIKTTPHVQRGKYRGVARPPRKTEGRRRLARGCHCSKANRQDRQPNQRAPGSIRRTAPPLASMVRQARHDQPRQPGHAGNLQNLCQHVNIGACPRNPAVHLSTSTVCSDMSARGRLIRGASARSIQGRSCETAAEAAHGWTASGSAMIAFGRLWTMCGNGSWNVDASNRAVRRTASPSRMMNLVHDVKNHGLAEISSDLGV